MENMIFRPAMEADLQLIASFPVSEDELFYVYPAASYPLTTKQMLANFVSRKGNSVLEVDGKPAAYANYISIDKGNDAVIGNVIVDPSLRGKGIGINLLTHMMDVAAKEFGAKKAVIPCFNSNTSGLIFYHNLGFLPFSSEIRQKENGKHEVLLYLQKSIKC